MQFRVKLSENINPLTNNVPDRSKSIDWFLYDAEH